MIGRRDRNGRLIQRMTTKRAELPGEEDEAGWRERIAAVVAAWRSLAQTRLAIFREELAEKASFASRGLLAAAVAGALGVGALLLLAGLLSALLAQLFGNVALGILGALVLYGAGAAAAGWIGWKALARVAPLDFPAVTEELSRDWKAVHASLSEQVEPDAAATPSARGAEKDTEDLEERFRAGEE